MPAMNIDFSSMIRGAMKGAERAFSGKPFGCHTPTTGVCAFAESVPVSSTASSETDAEKKIRILKMLVAILIGSKLEFEGE